MEYFKSLTNLLKIEKAEDQKQYQELTSKASVSERRMAGLTWYPVAIRGSEIGRGDYLTVEFERTTHHDLSHQFRFGTPVSFFSNHEPTKDRVDGIVTHQSANKIKVSLRTDELPDWASDGKLGLDVLFDNNTYEEMFSALKQAERFIDEESNDLIEVLVGDKKLGFNPDREIQDIPQLNDSQMRAVQKILSANELAIVHGPPGTGKTTTIVHAIQNLVKKFNQKLLVVAPSNTAVDLLTEKLSDAGLNVLRVGNPARISEKLSAQTLDGKISEHPHYKEIKRLKKQANEYKNMAHKYKRHFGKAERDQRKALFDEAHKIMKEVEKTEQYILEDLNSKAQVITATLVGSNHYTVSKLKYDTLVIDEAGQTMEPACWIPILKAKRLVLAGDHCQLPPTIKSKEADKLGLGLTLLERLVARHQEAVVLLDTQYRMNTKIMQHSSNVFYDSKLIAHESVAHKTLKNDSEAVLFIDTAGCAYNEKLEGTSSTNPEEAAFLVNRLEEFVSNLENNFAVSIAIISPYKQQILILNEFINESISLRPFLKNISVNTIDSFQGQERDAVFISMTRSNTNNDIGFLSDTRRMNVAMTRAKKKLVVIGDSVTIGTHPYYKDFIAYTESIGSYKSAWEYLN
jgi:ATP-dependent RNA/DNA helicase IGHMBP2